MVSLGRRIGLDFHSGVAGMTPTPPYLSAPPPTPAPGTPNLISRSHHSPTDPERPRSMLAGTATAIILGLARLSLPIRSAYSSTDFTCRRGLHRFSSPMVETVSPL